MSTPETKPQETKSQTKAPPKPSAIGGALKMIVPAVLAGAAAYGGSRAVGARTVVHEVVHEKAPSPAPGPTLALDPFLVTLQDGSHKSHPMKMTIAVEFDAAMKEEPKALVPRMRDAVLSHLRALSYEQVVDGEHLDKLRHELLERCREAGAPQAQRVLITDFVVQ